MKVKSDETLKINGEAKELRWIGNKESLPTDEESVTRMFNKWINFFLLNEIK